MSEVIIKTLLDGIENHPILYPILMVVIAFGVALTPTIIMMVTNKKLIISDLEKTLKNSFSPIKEQVGYLKKDFDTYVEEQENFNKRSENNIAMVLLCIQNLEKKITEIESPEQLEMRLSTIIEKALHFVHNEKMRIKCLSYANFVKTIIIDNFRHHNCSSFEELKIDSKEEYIVAIQLLKREFSIIFGEKCSEKYWDYSTPYKRFKESIDDIIKLKANSKKERYITTLIQLMENILAKLVDFVIRLDSNENNCN